MSRPSPHALPFADAATIVRANQKDKYFTSSLQAQIQDVMSIFKGQRFVNSHPEEITVFGKALYFIATTVIGARTLGEEYVDLIYVNRSGKRLPKLLPRALFTFSYVVLPYLITRVVRKLKSREEGSKSWLANALTSYSSVLDTLINIHIAVFYFEGSFYSLSKRLFGLRYAFGHNKDPQKLQRTGNYSVLGGIMLFQFAVKMLIKLNQLSEAKPQGEENVTEEKDESYKTIRKLEQLTKINTLIEENVTVSQDVNVDLADARQLPYIPESSRSCMLCLSLMVNPSAANCGHLFCWSCIVDWVRERPECPLCRQSCLEQNLLPLK